MSTDLSIFDPANLPAHVATFNETEGNIVSMGGVDSLTYKGKVWTVNIGGNKTPLMRRSEDGDEEARPTIPVVILDYAKKRGRSYYESAFVDGQSKMPVCWSPDSIAPDPASSQKQAPSCATCPMSVKGSKVGDDGVETAACQQYRMVAVQPYRKWDMPPLRLRLAVTSDFDGRNPENEAKGNYAFSQYLTMLKSRGVKFTSAVVTRLRFDTSKAYPKVLFSAVGWLTDEELPAMVALAKSPQVAELISATFTPNGGDGVHKDDLDEPDAAPVPPPPPRPRLTAPAATVAPAPAAPLDVEDLVAEAEASEGMDADEAAAMRAAEEAQRVAREAQEKVAQAAEAAKARKASAAAAPKVAPPKATPTKAATAAAPKGTPAKPTPAVSAEVGAIIDDWG